MFFFGTFRHNLDDKARCTIPTSFRDQLGKVVYGTKGLDNCINIYPEETFMKICNSNSTLNDFNSAERQFKRLFFSTSFKYEVDKSGRITLTKDHLSRAGIVVSSLQRFFRGVAIITKPEPNGGKPSEISPDRTFRSLWGLFLPQIITGNLARKSHQSNSFLYSAYAGKKLYNTVG